MHLNNLSASSSRLFLSSMLLKSEYSFDINKAKQITTLGVKKNCAKKLYEMNTVYGRKLDESKA